MGTEADRWHGQLLVIAERIARLRGERAALVERIAEIDQRITANTARHHAMVSSLAAGKKRRKQSDPSELPRVTRLLFALADAEEAMNANDLALELEDAPSAIYASLQDLKRRYGYVSGPEDGLWSITTEGLRDADRRRKEVAR